MGAKRGLKNLLIECFTRIYLRLILFVANLMTISSHFRAYKIKTYLLKLTLMKLDSNVFFDNGFDCVQPRNISIGKYCSFGHNNKFVAFNRIIIGPYVQSAIGLTLVAGSHRVDNYAPLRENQQIVLEGENWIGANVTIIGGVTIGRGSIIAAGAVVTEDIPAYSVAGGVPARVIKKRVPAPLVESPFGDYKPSLSS